ncbi:hypothetical protein MAR_002809 [Mya arenaria]|uniref:Uncharacterized protein n=1 Tax=Mya arenaria TaxID=6604 RepID=A0ABY7G859_MYAAR|nr:hypothetical protein MAR_002809 [Mya arenaria]
MVPKQKRYFEDDNEERDKHHTFIEPTKDPTEARISVHGNIPCHTSANSSLCSCLGLCSEPFKGLKDS